MATDLKQLLRESPLLRDLKEEQLDQLAARGTRIRVAPQTVVARQGRPTDSLHLIVNGTVAIVQRDDEAQSTLLEIRRGAVFGRGCVSEQQESADHQTRTVTELHRWSGSDLDVVWRHCPELRRRLTVRLSLYGRTRSLTRLLRGVRLFSSVSPALIRALLSESTLCFFESGEAVFREGDPGDAFYLVCTGSVVVQREDGDQLANLNAGDSFGEMALLLARPRSASVVATTATELLRVDRQDFEALCARSSRFRQNVALQSHHRLSDTSRATAAQSTLLLSRDHDYAQAMARLLAWQLDRDYQERTLLLSINGNTENMPTDGALAYLAADKVGDLPQLLVRWTTAGYRHVLVCCADRQLLQRVCDSVGALLCLDGETPADVAPAPLQQVHHVVDGQVTASRELRRASIRLDCEGNELRRTTSLDRLSERGRTSLGRLARALTHRSVGLALGGGGAWGYAHHCLLRALAHKNIPVDAVSSVSFGSVVGAFYASSGPSGLEQLEGLAHRVRQASYAYLFTTAPLVRLIEKALGQKQLETTALPFYPVATDIDAGTEFVFRRGNLAQAVRASAAMPGATAPVAIDNRRLVDGALVSLVPASILPEEGLDFVIASNVMQAPARQPPGPGGRLGNIRNRLSQSIPVRLSDSVQAVYIALQAAGELCLASAHASFQPILPNVTTAEFHRASEILDLAQQQAERAAEEIAIRYRQFAGLS